MCYHWRIPGHFVLEVPFYVYTIILFCIHIRLIKLKTANWFIYKMSEVFQNRRRQFFTVGQLIVYLEGEILTREILTVIMHRPFSSPLCWIIKRTVCHCVPKDFKIWMEFQYVDSVDKFWFFPVIFLFCYILLILQKIFVFRLLNKKLYLNNLSHCYHCINHVLKPFQKLGVNTTIGLSKVKLGHHVLSVLLYR